jgi:hypothetical protein
MRVDQPMGEALVRLARSAIAAYLREGRRIESPPADFFGASPLGLDGAQSEPERRESTMRAGVFVSLHRRNGDERELRGCIGFVSLNKPLPAAVVDAAIGAATEDPRFPPLTPEELERVVVEVSVLTEPKRLTAPTPLEYPSLIRPGRDGLIIKWSMGSGLLLPQVAVEFGWTAEDLLTHASMKAGGTPDLWLTPHATLYTFQAEVFDETSPGGQVNKHESP